MSTPSQGGAFQPDADYTFTGTITFARPPRIERGSVLGDVVGPASAVAGHLAVFSDPSGKVLADGGVVPSGDAGGAQAVQLARLQVQVDQLTKVVDQLQTAATKPPAPVPPKTGSKPPA